jgi:Mg2+-importing ATPase
MLVILAVASGVSALAGQTFDAALIAAMLCLSTGISAWQSRRSNRAAERLRQRIAPTACALRDGEWKTIPRSEVVRGDQLRFRAGDLVAADCRLLVAETFYVQQSALTGESAPVLKYPSRSSLGELGPDSPALVFLGTSVLSGQATGVVHAAGGATAYGEIVRRLSERPPETRFERDARSFGLLVFRVVVVLVFIVLGLNLAQGREPLSSFLFSVALAVGMTPEFLPLMATITLSQGAVRMARERVIVKHLSAIQNLGRMDVLCSDKTGTLTTGELSLVRTMGPEGTDSLKPLLWAALNSRVQSGIRTPFDNAILTAAARTWESGQGASLAPSEGRLLGELPFDFERRRHSVLVLSGQETFLVCKGAPESVLPLCVRFRASTGWEPVETKAEKVFLTVFDGLSALGLRVLAVATRSMERGSSGEGGGDGGAASGSDARENLQKALSPEIEAGLDFEGFLAFSDHPGIDAAETLRALARDGVRVLLLTGDNERVTRRVCAEVGLEAGEFALGTEIERLGQAELAQRAARVTAFARVSPVQKERIVRALQGLGQVVGFLGDGINDAPSLHAADVGISVAGAVDVAREASDIILLEHRLAVLHAGILAGRRSFSNLFKYLLMGTSSNFGNMLSMALAPLFLPFLPMLPAQILLNNLLYDLAQLAIPTDRVEAQLIRGPVLWDMRLLRRLMITLGPLSSAYDLLTFWFLLRVLNLPEPLFQTGWFVESLITQTLVIFSIRTVRRPWRDPPSIALAVTCLSVVGLALALPWIAPLLGWGERLGFHPLPPRYYVFLLGASTGYLALVELLKGHLLRWSSEAVPGAPGQRPRASI